MPCGPEASGCRSPQEVAPYVKEGVPSKLSWYELAIERQTYRALHELERRSAARRGASITPPYIVDVEVSRTPEPEWVPKPD
jgi:hypothetical protein